MLFSLKFLSTQTPYAIAYGVTPATEPSSFNLRRAENFLVTCTFLALWTPLSLAMHTTLWRNWVEKVPKHIHLLVKVVLEPPPI
jgi:hypothetical protein